LRFGHTPAVFGSVERRLLAATVAALIGGIVLLGPPPPIRAASDGLQIVAQTQYVALPAEKRVHVTVDARATNLTPDPPNGRYYYTAARFSVQPAIRNLTASSGGTTLAARVVTSSTKFTEIEVPFGRSIFHGVTYPFEFAFDIVDPGGAPQRDVRVAPSLVAFPVWAWGTSGVPGGAVSVSIPAGYTVEVQSGTLAAHRNLDGSTLLTAPVADPQTFFAYLTAERPGAFRQTSTTIRLPEGVFTVLVRAWEDDPDWGARTRGIISKGLPVLRSLIGLDYQVHGQLRVEEAAGAQLGDYAGVYNPVAETIDVRYDADGYTTLHETAHTWFNDTLFSDRWISEAWAEYYGVEAGKRIKTDGQGFVVTPQLAAAKFPLNSWGAIGTEPQLTEAYAYAGSYRLAQLIAARAGAAGLQSVWRAAEDGEASYQPSHPGSGPEKGVPDTVAGWQRFLDLLEERTHHSYADLWQQWVMTTREAQQLNERATARTDYARTVTSAGDWQLPDQIRYELGAWQFGGAQIELANARSVLVNRDRIASEAAHLELHVPGTLRSDFESGRFNLAKQDADAQMAALSALRSAGGAIDRTPTALEWVGLLFADPGHTLSRARAAFQDGDATTATKDAQTARAERASAADAGRIRAGVVGGAGLTLDALAMAALAFRRRRYRATGEDLTTPSDPSPPLTDAHSGDA
jgi:hypothetical protein